MTGQPPAALVGHIRDLNLDGCRCPWQLRPRSGWARLSTGKGCPHHDPEWRRRHLDTVLRQLVPRDFPLGDLGPSALGACATVVRQIHELLWATVQVQPSVHTTAPDAASPALCDWGCPVPNGEVDACRRRSRFRVVRSGHDPGYIAVEACEDHLKDVVPALLEGREDVKAIVTVHWDDSPESPGG